MEDYMERVNLLVSKWNYIFNENMEDLDFKEFKKDCKNLNVKVLDVLESMKDE